MKILQLCKKFPYPLKDGEAIAVTYLSKALRDLGCEITLLCMNTTKHYMDLGRLPSDFDHYKEIHCTELDNSIKPIEAFLHLFKSSSYHVTRFVSDEFRDKLIEVLQSESFDIIQLETLYLAPYVETIKEYSKAPIVMRAHNVEHEIWDRISSNTSFFPKKWYLNHLTKKLKEYEVGKLNSYDYLIALTQRDLRKFKTLGYKNGASASPIGIVTDHYKVQQSATDKPLSICFIGSLDWIPNIEGLNWFLYKVWPGIVRHFPDVTLHVAGRNTPPAIEQLHLKNVVIHGEVPDAKAFISRHTAMVVPLFSGSGMRVKILEGMALGKVIISTSLGAEGIDARHMQELMIADDEADFIEAIGYLVDHPEQVSDIGESARAFVKDHYCNQEIAFNLYRIYEELLVTDMSHS